MATRALSQVRKLARPLLRAEARLGTPGVAAAAIGLLAAQQLAIRALEPEGAALLPRTAVIYLSTAALVVLVLHFRRFVGAWLVSLGIAFNLVAMTANNGSMPIAFEDIEGHTLGRLPPVTEEQVGKRLPDSKDIVLRRSDINLVFFGDQHLVNLPMYGENIYSLGDVILFGGLVLAAGQGLIGQISPRRRALGEPAR